MPDQPGQFGEFGGRHLPEPLGDALEELVAGFDELVPTEDLQSAYRDLLENDAGRPTPVTHAGDLSGRGDENVETAAAEFDLA